MNIIDLKSEKGEKIVQCILSDTPVVLIGSGVSIWKPTNLPAGQEFVNQFFQLIFPECFLVNNSETRFIIEEHFKGNCHRNIPGLPFEVLFEGCPNKEKVLRIFKDIFSTDRYNPIHKALADHFLSGGFSAVITTNYDICLDTLLGFSPATNQITRIVTQDDTASNTRLYFKIHGTADDAEGGTLVFALSQESRLPEWKRALLHTLLNQHSLLIVGYSGSDFELCPELSLIPMKEIYWNIGNDDISLNARRLAQCKTVYFLRGDMRDLLNDITGTNVKAEKGKSDRLFRSIELDFTHKELMEWRAFLLYKMGFSLQAMRVCNDLELLPLSKRDEINIMRLKARLLFHLGKYRQSAELYSALAEKSKQIDGALQTESFIDASAAYRCYGKLTTSSRCLNTAKEVIDTIDEKDKKRLLSKMHLCQAGSLIFEYKFARVKELFMRTRNESTSIKESIYENLCKTCEYAVACGSWFDFQEAALWAQQMGIEIDSLTKEMRYPPPPPPREGYRHLTSNISRIIEARTHLNGRGALTSTEKEELNELLQFCRITGNNPEIWKLLSVTMKRDNERKVKNLVEFFYFYGKCEYSLLFRILYLCTAVATNFT